MNKAFLVSLRLFRGESFNDIHYVVLAKDKEGAQMCACRHCGFNTFHPIEDEVLYITNLSEKEYPKYGLISQMVFETVCDGNVLIVADEVHK